MGCHAMSMFLLLAELLDWLEPQHSSSMTSDLVYPPSFIWQDIILLLHNRFAEKTKTQSSNVITGIGLGFCISRQLRIVLNLG